MERGMQAEPPLTGVRFANDISGHYQQQRETTPANTSSGFSHGRRPSINQRANSQELSHALDLADPANRQAPSPDVAALLDRKRQEHEKARKVQQEAFQAQMRELEAQQAAEEARLLGATSQSSHSPSSRSNSDMSGQQQQQPPSASSVLHSRLMPSFSMPPSASAPTTPPPRSPAHSNSPNGSSGPDNDRSRQAYERMSRSDVLTRPGAPPSDGMPPSSADWMPNYNATAPTSPVAQFGPPGAGAQRSRMNKAKSQPVSRRHSGDDLQADGQPGDQAALADGFDRMHINGNVNHRSASSSNLRDVKTSGPPGSEAPLLTSFLFDDELDAELSNPTFDGKYLAMTDEDKFPILVRRDSHPGVTHLSAASAALDLAPLSQTPPRSSGFMMHANSRTSEWPQQNRQQSAAEMQHQQPFRTRGFDAQQQMQPQSHQQQRMASLQHPSMQHANAGPMSSHASLSPVHSRVSSPVAEVSPRKGMNMPHAATAPESPVDYATNKRSSTGLQSAHANGSGFAGEYQNQSCFLPYSSAANAPKDPYASYGELNRSIPSPQQQVSSSRGDNGFGYGSRMSSRGSAIQHLQQPQPPQPKRLDDVNRFAGLRLEDLQGDMASLCKDQHGCRFLQRKLEEGNPQHRDMIFAEVYPHFAELMVDSFGNYLAQRLLEFSSDEQKDILITSVHDDLVSISLNIHGTRAIQRLIDHLTTPRQVSALVSALNGHVVTLIKDLNGNHVIQKCLNSLKPEDNQFIYNAVTANCIEVATHRHGCCVLQRCIDHASESQRVQLVTEITYQCLTLVQDPFSNYVVQYCLEFDRRFVEAIIRQFQGNVCALSCHKFSSNVIEKCIRVADNEGRRIIVGEMLERGRLERLVKDNFANYVVQTACDFADPVQRDQLVQQIRPLLPQIRNTPYGKRIAARIQRMPQPTNRFMGYPMSGGFAYGPPQLGYPPNPPLLDAFQHRAFPPQAQMPAPAFMPFGPGGPDYGHSHPHHHPPMPQATGPSPFGGPPFM